MEWYVALILILGIFAVLAALGLPIAFAFLASIIVSSMFAIDFVAGPELVISHVFESLAQFSLVPVPLFILLGELLFQSGLATRAVESFGRLLGRLPARESFLALGSGGIFSALTGSTMANTALLGSMLAPQMRERGYSKQLTYGPILAAGGLAMIIPPSNLAVIYGSYAGVSISALLVAGIGPGLLLLTLYSALMVLIVYLSPSKAPPPHVPQISAREKLVTFFVDLAPLGAIIFLVTGLIVLGIATPTESAALGALGAFVLVAGYKRLSWSVIHAALASTVKLTGMIFLILAGAVGFSQLLAFTGVTREIVGIVVALEASPTLVFFLMIAIVLVLGSFMESVPIIMIVTPIFVPVVDLMGWDPVWFAILVLMSLQVGLTTPPFGMLLFVLKGVVGRDATMGDMYKAAAPFILCDLLLMFAIWQWPAIATWLPSTVGK